MREIGSEEGSTRQGVSASIKQAIKKLQEVYTKSKPEFEKVNKDSLKRLIILAVDAGVITKERTGRTF
jgi:hypothetical protein